MPPLPPEDGAGGRKADPEALQILATEHWSLLATRGLTWTETFSRSGMFLTVLSGAVVALALIAQATGFGDQFQTFALFLLPVVVFVGITTYLRLVAVGIDEVRWIIAMNRIRAAYLARRPDLAVHFSTGFTDDIHGVGRTYGFDGGKFGPASAVIAGLTTTSSLVGTVTSVVAGFLAGTLATKLGGGTGVATIAGVAVACVVFALLIAFEARNFFRFVRGQVPRFPTPPGDRPAA